MLPCRAVGLVIVTQKSTNGGREHNDRLIAVPVRSAAFGDLRDARSLPERMRREMLRA